MEPGVDRANPERLARCRLLRAGGGLLARSLVLLALLVPSSPAQAQGPAAGGADAPVLRLQAGGPTSYVTGLAFTGDGRGLYEAGWDKVVRVWAEDPRTGRLVLDERATLRVPLGPGLDGAINAMALSPDGAWLAVAGRGVVPGSAGFLQNGLIVPSPAKTDAMRWAEGTIFVFNTKARVPTAVALRGHRGPVLSLVFAPSRPGKPPLLVSAGHEMDRTAEVRLWDVSTGEYLTGFSGLPGPLSFKTRPSLAAWHTGPGRNQVRVMIAWWAGEFGKDRGTLRFWDADGKGLSEHADGQVNDTLALVADPPMLLSGSFSAPGGRPQPAGPHGQITTWSPLGGPGRPVAGKTIALKSEGPNAATVFYLPRALAVVAGAGGKSRYVATIVQELGRPAGQGGYELRLIDLDPQALGTTRARFPLRMSASAASAQPSIAADRAGGRLAVALGESREVVLYSIPELLAGRSEPRQVLRTAGISHAYVGFARRGKDAGLIVGSEAASGLNAPPRMPGPADLIYDFSGRRLTAERGGWVATTPPVDDWTIAPAPGGRSENASVQVRQGNRPPRTITLPAGESVTALAFHPRPPGGTPIVAVASQLNSGEPMLRLYSATSGEWIRQLTGHSERIRSLAFAEDGRLLASTADDRTTSVWSLVDLRDTLGKRGQVRGLSVTERGGRLVVKEVEAGATALRAGDFVDGIVEQGILRPLRSVVDFYNAVSVFPPGRPVTLRRSRAQQPPGDVAVPVGQGTDERKPLFSLFFTPGEEAGDWRWVGWNPQGPYETSGPEVEALIGWHFNTGNPASPTRFALAPEYHNRFYHHDILKTLVDRGSLPPPAPPPLPAPNMSMAFDSAAELAGSQIVVRQAPRALTLTIVDRPIPEELVGAVSCQVGSLPPVELEPASDRSWTADVSGLAWAPGIYPVRLTFKTTETAPQTFTLFRELRYQRPAPDVKPANRLPLVVNDPQFVLRTEIVPAGSTSVRVRITRDPGGIFQEQVVRERTNLEKSFRLEPGSNRFTVVATNVGAIPGYEDEETTELPALLVNWKQKALAPSVELTAVPAGSNTVLVPQRGATVLVTDPKLSLRGRIVAQEPLVSAERQQAAGAGPSARLAGFVPGGDKAFSINEPLALEPGLHTYIVRARAADSDPGEGRITIEYQPRLPRVETVELDPARPVLFEHEDEPRVSVQARLIPPEDLRPVKAEVLVNSEGEAQPRVIPAEVAQDPAGAANRDEPGLRLSANVPLAPGENHLRIRLQNEWGAVWTGDESIVAYRRPPRIVEVTAPAKTEKGTIAVEGIVESPLELIEAQFEVTQDEPRRVKATFVRRHGNSWKVSSDQVPLEPGSSSIRLLARNADGWNHLPGPDPRVAFSRPRVLEPPVIAPPEVPGTTSDSELRTTLLVTSARPIQSIEVRRKVSASEWVTVPAPALEPIGKDDRGRLKFRAPVRLGLVDGLNHLEAAVRSEDGIGRVNVIVSRVQTPIRFVIDGFEPQSNRRNLLRPDVPLPDGQVWVTGRVLWPDAEMKRRSQSKRVQIMVNGFPQIEAPLLAEGRAVAGASAVKVKSTESAFRAGLLLGRTDNTIEVKLGDAPCATESRPLPVACLKPDTRQRLHLLIIGIGSQDKTELKAQALQAVQGELLSDRENERLFKTPAFTSGKIYGPLSDEFTKMHVLAQVSLICEQIRLQNNLVGSPTSNEVVLIYYQGGEWIGEGKTALLLRRGRVRKEVAGISVDELVRPFVGTRGAKLLLLDVATPAPLARTEPWSRDVAHVGLLRFMWLYPGESKPGEVPPDARLLSAMKDVVPSSVTLGQVTSQLAGRYSLLREKYPNLNFEDRPLPEPFFDLVFGRP